jgi:hypothetical protein
MPSARGLIPCPASAECAAGGQPSSRILSMAIITVKCKTCAALHLVNLDTLDFEQVNADEREMGAEVAFEGCCELHCVCGKSIEVTHRFWEYPIGVENHWETEVSGGTAV